ncbi:penicillin-binding protein 1C [Formivibrio citricus]|uniref:penicillin-binding protein 1C n=1 Tax=Formivibrio citricus TaxID=83765 RepID=UPI001C42FB9C|nr:penicillin-binding protein 1C [Formivibrio citricus]
MLALLLLAPLPAQALPSFSEVKQGYHSSDAILLDRHGEVIQRLRIDKTVRRGDWMKLNEISPAMRLALIVSEDKRFYRHSGVDWRAVGAATWGNLWNSKTRGASTITMQLAGLLDEDLRQKTGGRSVGQKVGQAVSASWLERSWRKDQILEAYLNLAPFRGELVGVSALSQRLFNKFPSGLNEEESALAAALVRGPNATPEQVAQRACVVLREMQPPKSPPPDCSRLPDITRLLLTTPATPQRDEGIAPHFARRMAGNLTAPATIRSTLDARLQRFAADTLRRHLRELVRRNVEDGAAIVIDNASGEVLAWIGSGGPLSSAAEVDNVLARRQAGSTLKPFLYAQAIAEKHLTAASLLEDSPVNLPTGNGQYIPRNYDNRFKGWVSVRTALGSSLNIPAVRTLVMVTPHRFQKTLAGLDLPLEQSGDFYGYSLALGSADVTLASLANAYRALANGGKLTALKLRPEDRSGSPRKALDPLATFVVTDILADRNARAATFGLDSPLATRYWSAVKTGTSKDMRDNWCIGFSRRYTVGVWVGNASGAPMWDVSGITGAAPVWHAIMDRLHAGTRSPPPAAPAGLKQARISYEQNIEPARNEWFLPGTAQTRIRLAQASARQPGIARISQPLNGALYALDPDIPPANQRIAFTSDNPSAVWRLDGKRIGKGRKIDWPLWPGPHRLELLDEKGKVVDTVRFEVRGAGVKDNRNK